MRYEVLVHIVYTQFGRMVWWAGVASIQCACLPYKMQLSYWMADLRQPTNRVPMQFVGAIIAQGLIPRNLDLLARLLLI